MCIIFSRQTCVSLSLAPFFPSSRHTYMYMHRHVHPFSNLLLALFPCPLTSPSFTCRSRLFQYALQRCTGLFLPSVAACLPSFPSFLSESSSFLNFVPFSGSCSFLPSFLTSFLPFFLPSFTFIQNGHIYKYGHEWGRKLVSRHDSGNIRQEI